MKKLLIIILAILLIGTTACSGGTAPEVSASQPAESTASPQAAEPQPSDTPEPQDQEVEATVDEAVLLEQDGIRISLKSLDYSGFMGPSLEVLVENDSDKKVTIQARDANVNDVMVSTTFSCDIDIGKKANDSITIDSSSLDAAGISVMKDIQLRFHVFDSESWDTVFDSDLIDIKTSATDHAQNYDDSGNVVFDQDGFKMVVKEVDSESSFWGADLHVYIENNSDKKATLQLRDVSANGFMIDPTFSCDVLPGKKAFDSITFMQSDLEANSITEITDLEFVIHIFETDGFDTILDSDKITVAL